MRLGGQYELIRRLAVGGMAEIFLARVATDAFEKLVVIKRILPPLAKDEEFVRMFVDEARLAAKLQHPNIAQVFDSGHDDAQPFFAMEYVRGRDLDDVMAVVRERGRPIDLEAALGIVIGICAGLHYAHDLRDGDGTPLGIVHRDVSPSNVIVRPDGTVKMVDFGVAKAASHRAVTRAGLIKGKLAYMSPEQCCGDPVDRRGDIFSIGILLYELTTGRRLFVGDTDEDVMRAVVQVVVPPPSLQQPSFPAALEAILSRALARDPGARYATAEELQLDLENFARDHRLVTSNVEVARAMKDLFGDSLMSDEGDHQIGLPPSVLLTAPSRSTSPARWQRRARLLFAVGGVFIALAIWCAAASRLAAASRRRALTYETYGGDRISERGWWRTEIIAATAASLSILAALEYRRRARSSRSAR